MAATLKDIAKETGLSVATISKYINGATLKEKNRVTIERAIKKLGYTVNEYARGLKAQKSHTIGVIIPELSNLFITQIITVVEEILQEKGYSVIICDCHTEEERECKAVKFLLRKMVDGIINMPVCRDGRHLIPATEKGIPIVLVDRMVELSSPCIDYVLIDNIHAAEDATRYLLENGHRHIGIILGEAGIFTSAQRLEGYRQAFINAGYPIPSPEHVIHSDYTVQGGYASMRRLLKAGDCSAVFVTNYEMTLGAMIAINEMGKKIPEEISLIGFDNLDLSQIMHPRLTIVTQPLEKMGAQIARLLLEHLAEEGEHTPVCLALSAALQKEESVANIRNRFVTGQ